MYIRKHTEGGLNVIFNKASSLDVRYYILEYTHICLQSYYHVHAYTYRGSLCKLTAHRISWNIITLVHVYAHEHQQCVITRIIRYMNMFLNAYIYNIYTHIFICTYIYMRHTYLHFHIDTY